MHRWHCTFYSGKWAKVMSQVTSSMQVFLKQISTANLLFFFFKGIDLSTRSANPIYIYTHTHKKHLINFIFSLCQETKQLANMEARGNMKGTVWDKETKVNKNKPEQQTSSYGHPRNRKSSSRVMTCAARHIAMRLSTPKDNIYTEKLCAECQYHKVIRLPVITSKFHQIRVK